MIEFPIVCLTSCFMAFFARIALLLALFCASVSAQAQQKIIQGRIGFAPISMLIAQSSQEQQLGLMHRQQLPDNTGMLFTFKRAHRVCMWMKNVHMDLEVAFFDQDGVLFEIEPMQKHTLDLHCSKKPAKYALETPSGWFQEHQVKLGDKLYF